MVQNIKGYLLRRANGPQNMKRYLDLSGSQRNIIKVMGYISCPSDWEKNCMPIDCDNMKGNIIFYIVHRNAVCYIHFLKAI